MEELQTLVRLLCRLFIVTFLLIGLVFVGLYTYKPTAVVGTKRLATDEKGIWQPKNPITELANMPAKVKEGYYFISETAETMGPSAPNAEDRYSGNNLACTNCHLQSGTQAGAASWIGVTERFPQFGGRSNTVGSIQDRINGCLERSMNGKALPEDAGQLQAIVAYMTWLGEGLPAAKKEEYKGYRPIHIPEEAVDLEKGKIVYAKECVLCHGENGQGVKKPNGAKGYQYPPLWGADSYNDGAGMNRVITAAEFIKSNMPFGQATWDNPKLTDAEAFHVAGYINSFDRPKKPQTEKDYPDRKLKPVSTPYGPWEDGFSAEQHKYGPFPPIIAYYKQRYNIVKNK